MGYKLSRKAEDDIIRVYVEGVTEFGIPQAEKYYAGLHQLLDLLGEKPELSRERTEVIPPVRVHRYVSHIVVYTIDDDGDALILRVPSGKEDWQNNPV